MKTAESERAIAAKIKEAVTDLKVEAISDGNADKLSLHGKGSVFVHYSGSKYSDSKYDTAVILQDRILYFDIFVTIKGIKDSNDAQNYLDDIREVLTGYQIDKTFTKMMPVSDQFVGKEDDYWYYSAKYKCSTKNTEESIAYGFQ